MLKKNHGNKSLNCYIYYTEAYFILIWVINCKTVHIIKPYMYSKLYPIFLSGIIQYILCFYNNISAGICFMYTYRSIIYIKYNRIVQCAPHPLPFSPSLLNVTNNLNSLIALLKTECSTLNHIFTYKQLRR